MAESKLADFEKEKMMIELDVKETIARHKTEVTERMARAAKVIGLVYCRGQLELRSRLNLYKLRSRLNL